MQHKTKMKYKGSLSSVITASGKTLTRDDKKLTEVPASDAENVSDRDDLVVRNSGHGPSTESDTEDA